MPLLSIPFLTPFYAPHPTVLDLLDGFLIPIGLARRIEGGHMCITPATRHLPCFDTFTLKDPSDRAAFFASLVCDRSTCAA